LYPPGRQGDYVIPDSVTEIEHAFKNCTGLTSVTIPGSVTKIGNSVFRDCTGLTSITIIKIKRDPFYHGTVIPLDNHSYESEDGVLFNEGKTKLILYPPGRRGNYVIPDSVTKIGGKAAFENCAGLRSITIPNSVIKIGGEAFDGCTRLTSVTISDSVTKIGRRAFSGCTGLTSITIPNSVTEIGWRAFSGCPAFINVHPDNPAYRSENGKLHKKQLST
jgi:hypothetical protein